MMTWATPMLLALALATTTAVARPALADEPDCQRPVATVEVDLCMALELERADAALAIAHQRTLARLRELRHEGACTHCDAAARQLDRAGNHWTQLREADCEAAYAVAADGSGRNQARLGCMLDHARARQSWLAALIAMID